LVLAIGWVTCTLAVTILDEPGPAAARRAARLDEVAEALQVTADPTLDDAKRVRRLLDEALRLDLELQDHLGPLGTERLAPHETVVVGALDAAPCHQV